jgi:ABC-2 type transport system ATP-binding protein
MHSGRLLVEGAPRDLTAGMAGHVLELAAHPKDKARQIAQSDPEVEDVLTFGDRFHLRVKATAGPLERLPERLASAGINVERLRAIPPSLEDAFISLLARGAAEGRGQR